MPLKPEVRKAIFVKLKTLLAKQCPPMVCSKDKADCYEIIGNTPVPHGGTKKIVPGMYFASTVAWKDMVSFYFMPIYYDKTNYVDIVNLPRYFGHQEKTLSCVRRCPNVRTEATASI